MEHHPYQYQVTAKLPTVQKKFKNSCRFFQSLSGQEALEMMPEGRKQANLFRSDAFISSDRINSHKDGLSFMQVSCQFPASDIDHTCENDKQFD